MKMERTECSEMSAYKIQMLGNYPEENIQPAGAPYLYKLYVNSSNTAFSLELLESVWIPVKIPDNLTVFTEHTNTI
jgi:hypothetical protein